MLTLRLSMLACVAIGFVNCQRELIYVQAVWRHGDRAPNKLPYPKDVNTENQWPRGWSQLTNRGIKELYDLGEFFSTHYAQFIGTTFHMNEIMVTSTNSERAIVSAQAFLRGMFPAKGTDVWAEGETWQPLPFYSRAFGDSDPMLRPTEWECSLYSKVVEEQNKQLFSDLEKEYADFFNFLQNVTGFPKVNLDKAASLNNIQREIIHGLPQPAWVYRTWPAHANQTTIEIVMELKRIERISEFNSPEKARLRGGLLLGDWIRRALNVSSNQTITPTKMNLYSTHDGTVSSLMYAMGIGNDRLIPYAACLIMEIYQATDNATEVRLLYKNQTDSDNVHTMIIPGCQEFCSVDNFSRLLSPNALSDETELKQACCAGINDDTCNLSKSGEYVKCQRLLLLISFLSYAFLYFMS